ncbi:MAG TPA: ATP-binding cassette domain-containing protein [Dehalococcoidia bacterium]|nr:ATP-binding cassette domain-containing protein [Dehalococcoidia bacterium]
MQEPRILELEGLSKTITLHILDSSEVEPFKDVSFHVDEGEFVAIVGPSGSGKSSIVKAIHRTYLPTAGAAHYRTAASEVVDLASAPDRRLIQLRRHEIGFVSQFLKVEPRVPAVDVVAGPLLRRGLERAEARSQARGLLERLDIPQKLWGSYPTLFSGGEQQRVNIARALIARPRLLLADEPTSALDTMNTGRVIELLTETRRQGMTIVGVFHDLELIERLADRVIVMEGGRVIAQGPVGQVEIPRFDLKQEFAPRV